LGALPGPPRNIPAAVMNERVEKKKRKKHTFYFYFFPKAT
jgi:hypothetical protein